MLGSNLQFSNKQSDVDLLNTEFYGKIKFPWPPSAFERVRKEGFWSKMISQDLGYWRDEILPKNCKIWVAGCGTNQAIFTALKFPSSQIIGSDLSKESLEVCKKNAEQLNVKNLDLRNESINDSSYNEQFDYIICTGVIHHNSNPEIPLQRLSKALKSSGVIELMVYNKFHRIYTSAFQLAVRMIAQCNENPNLEKELLIAKMMVNSYGGKNKMGDLLETMKYIQDAAFADSLLQPVEHSYTIESLDALTSDCGLELLTFCLDQFSRAEKNYDWNLRFESNELQSLYENLPDIKRWYITNLLQGEISPMLWFYAQKKNSQRLRKTEKQICEEFLNTKFRKINIEKEIFVLNDEGLYNKHPITVNFPTKERFFSKGVKEFYGRLLEDQVIGKTFEKCEIPLTFSNINMIRSCLATSSYPYLEAYV